MNQKASENKANAECAYKERKMNEEKLYCSLCGKETSTEEYESYDGFCWECWDDQMTEECEFEEDII